MLGGQTEYLGLSVYPCIYGGACVLEYVRMIIACCTYVCVCVWYLQTRRGLTDTALCIEEGIYMECVTCNGGSGGERRTTSYTGVPHQPTLRHTHSLCSVATRYKRTSRSHWPNITHYISNTLHTICDISLN